MATGKSIQSFDVADVSGGCNYADDITALTKNQSPDSMNVEFYNGRLCKRDGETAVTTPPSGQGGNDTYTKLLIHADGTPGATTFTDEKGNTITNSSTLDSYTKALFHFEGAHGSTTITEETGRAVTNTDVICSTSAVKIGTSSGYFNGTTAKMSVPDSADFSMGASAFTMDAWVRQSVGASANVLWGQYSGTPSPSWALITTTSNLLLFYHYNSGYVIEISCPFTVVADTWYHIALVRIDGGNSAASWRMFINGVSQTLTLLAGAWNATLLDVPGALEIGSQNGANEFGGYIDELRISKGIARWTEDFTPPTVAYPIQAVVTASGKFSQAMSFERESYLTLPDNSNWDFGTGDFTIDFWFKPSVLGINAILLSTYTGGLGYVIQLNSSNNLLFIQYSPSISVSQSGGTGWSIGTWYHIAVVRSGTTFDIYRDGVSIATGTDADAVTRGGSQVLSIGALYNAGAVEQYTVGAIDELRISKGIARWTDEFTPPSLPYDAFDSGVPQVGFSLVDFSDTNDYHQQIAHIGTSVYKYDRISTTRTTLRTGAPFARSFNAKVKDWLIQTYSNYSVPYYWNGSSASMAVLTNAPAFKRCIEFQGYLMGINTAANPGRIYYQGIGDMLGAITAYADYFTLTPMANDDEATDPFLLNGRLYVGTKNSIFRISFVGGVTVFDFKQVISDVGIVPNTAQVVITKEFGQVVLFLGSDKRVYLFDGANVKTISDLFYDHNDSTPISLDLIDDNYRDNAFAVYDYPQRIYRLFVTKKSQSQNYYCLNIDVDTFAYYPFDYMVYAAGAICFDLLLRPFLLCLDYEGKIHKMFMSANTDNGRAIDEYYCSPLVSVKNAIAKQGADITVRQKPTSSANLIVYEKVDFLREWKLRCKLPCAGSRDKFLGESFVLGSSKLASEYDTLHSRIAINASFNHYQFKIKSDSPSKTAWEIIDFDFNQALLAYGKSEAQH